MSSSAPPTQSSLSRMCKSGICTTAPGLRHPCSSRPIAECQSSLRRMVNDLSVGWRLIDGHISLIPIEVFEDRIAKLPFKSLVEYTRCRYAIWKRPPLDVTFVAALSCLAKRGRHYERCRCLNRALLGMTVSFYSRCWIRQYIPVALNECRYHCRKVLMLVRESH